jgi:D-3-phosphoglycerate dehydrogenase
VPIAQHHIVMLYTDRPGIVAIYGQKFGDAGINIAGLQVARSQRGAQLSVLTVDSRVPEELLDEVREAIQADLLVQLEITEA